MAIERCCKYVILEQSVSVNEQANVESADVKIVRRLSSCHVLCACADSVHVTWCAHAQIQFWWKIKPQEAIKDKFGVPIPTSGRMNRAPMRIVLALDVSHSMSEPFGEDEGFLESEVLFRCLFGFYL